MSETQKHDDNGHICRNTGFWVYWCGCNSGWGRECEGAHCHYCGKQVDPK